VNARLTFISEAGWYIPDMAKVRPSNLFLRPLDLFYNHKFGQKISIKADIVTLSSLIWNSAARDEK